MPFAHGIHPVWPRIGHSNLSGHHVIPDFGAKPPSEHSMLVEPELAFAAPAGYFSHSLSAEPFLNCDPSLQAHRGVFPFVINPRGQGLHCVDTPTSL